METVFFQGLFMVKIIFIMLFLFFFYFICTAGTKTLVSRTASVLAQIKTVALNCTNSHCVLYFQALTVKKKSVLLNVLDKTVKINFIESQPLSAFLLMSV